MQTKTTTLSALLAALLATATHVPQAQALVTVTFGGGVSIDFVDIGNVSNTADLANTVNGANPGAVNYAYRMGKYEISANQWNAVIGQDSNVGNAGT